MVEVPGELDRARAALSAAYQQARAAGYPPGSPQMQALEAAEQTYRRAQDRHLRTQALHLVLDQDRQDGEDPVLDLDAGNEQLDLRDGGARRQHPPGRGAPPGLPAGERE